MRKLVYNQPDILSVKYTADPLEALTAPLITPTVTMGQITDCTMNLKIDTETDADDAYLQKLRSAGGVTTDPVDYRFDMHVMDTDFGNLIMGTTYTLVLAAQVPGYTNMLELDMAHSAIMVVPDKNRA